MKRLTFTTLFGLLSLAIPGFAAPVLTFVTGIAPSDAGAITISGTTITGVGIGFQSLGVTGATSGNGTWTLGGSANGGYAAFGFTFNTSTGTGTFSLVGTATQGSNVVASTNLLTNGIITGATNTTSGTSFNLAFNAGTTLAADGLETFLGIPINQSYSITGFEVGSSGGGYPYNATSSRIAATAISATPEPMSVYLFGSGLLAIAGFARKSRRKQ